MSREHPGPFWVARILELPNPEAGGQHALHQHLGSTAAIALRTAWGGLKRDHPYFGSSLTRFSGSSVVIVHEAEIAAAVSDEESHTIDPKLVKAVTKGLGRYIPGFNKSRPASARERPTQPISECLQVPATMFGGVQVMHTEGSGVHFVVRLKDVGGRPNQEGDPVRSLHAERDRLLGVIHEEAGYKPGEEDGVGIVIGRMKAHAAAMEIPYHDAHGQELSCTASNWLQAYVASVILEARSAGDIMPATAGPMQITYEV